MKCDYCRFRYSWDCEDNRHDNCKSFELDWNTLSDKEKRTIERVLSNKN